MKIKDIFLLPQTINRIVKDYPSVIEKNKQISSELDVVSKKKETLEMAFMGKSKEPFKFNVQPNGQSFGAGGNAKNRRRFNGQISFQDLRAFSVTYDIARAAINARKRQVGRLSWNIVPIDPKQNPDSLKDQIKLVTDFFKHPKSQYSSFRQLVNMMVEDLLVLDAMVLYKVKDQEDNLVELLPTDGATINLRITDEGRTPLPPTPAYEQWVNGKKTGSWTVEEMVYQMINPRTNTPYGLSPLESLIIDVHSALSSQLANLSYLQEGNIPEGLYKVPKEWSEDQIQSYQSWFDALMAGNAKYTSRIKFLPGGEGSGYVPTKKIEDMRFKEFEEWLAIKTAAMFQVPPKDLGITMDVNKATSVDQTEVSKNFGLLPIVNLLEETFDNIITQDFGFEDIRFDFTDIDEKDNEIEAKIAKQYIPIGVLSINEVRQDFLGKEPIEGGDHYIQTGAGPIFIDDTKAGERNPVKGNVVEPKKEEKENKKEDKKEEKKEKIASINYFGDLRKWRKKAIKQFKSGKEITYFKSEIIPNDIRIKVEDNLDKVDSVGSIDKIFEPLVDQETEKVMKAATELQKEISSILYEQTTENSIST